MQTHIEKAENGYTVRFMDEYWTEDGKRTETGKGYRTATETLRVYTTLSAAVIGIAAFYGVLHDSVTGFAVEVTQVKVTWEHTVQTIKDLCVEGLLTDGGHHKQWTLERVLEACGFDLALLAKELAKDDYEWEQGVAP